MVKQQSITITLACPPQKLKPNVRSHHMAKANATRQYRAHAADAATDECEQLGNWEPITEPKVEITYFHETRRFMDRDNILASLKAAFDGFTDAGLWNDDHACLYMPIRREKDADNPRVEITVSEGHGVGFDFFAGSD